MNKGIVGGFFLFFFVECKGSDLMILITRQSGQRGAGAGRACTKDAFIAFSSDSQ